MEKKQASAWAEYRKWRKVFLWSVPAGVIAVVLSGGSAGAAFLFFMLMLVGFSTCQNFRCPSCGETFFHDRFFNPMAKRCVHCRFPKWAEPAPGFRQGKPQD